MKKEPGHSHNKTPAAEAKDVSQVSDDRIMLDAILDGTMAGYWDWYIQEDYEYMSPKLKGMFGYKDHELPNRPDAWQKIIHPDDLSGVFEVFKAHVQSRGEIPYENEVRYFHKDGSIIWVFCRGKVIEWGRNGEPLRMVGSHVDITKLKAAEEKLRTAHELLSRRVEERTAELEEANQKLKQQTLALERSNAELKQYAHIASHDLQEPLRKISSFTEKLANKYRGQLDAKADRYLDFIVDGANRMRRLINDVLNFSMIDRPESPVEEVDCNEILSHVLNFLEKTVRKKKATVEIDTLPVVRGRKSQLTQLFQNLIANALKFGDKEKTIVKIVTEERQSDWLFSVQDNGRGIEKKYQKQVFELFKRLHSRFEYTGTGIGLAVCRKIVDHHGGKIWVRSEVGNGATFFFTIAKDL